MSPNPVNNGLDDLQRQMGLFSLQGPETRSGLGDEYDTLLREVFPVYHQRQNYENARYERYTSISQAQSRLRQREERVRDYIYNNGEYALEANDPSPRWDQEEDRINIMDEIGYLMVIRFHATGRVYDE